MIDYKDIGEKIKNERVNIYTADIQIVFDLIEEIKQLNNKIQSL